MRITVSIDDDTLTISGLDQLRQQSMKIIVDLVKEEDRGSLQMADIERLRAGFPFLEIDN